MSAGAPTLLHALAGRCRLRVPGLQADASLRGGIERQLSAHPLVLGFQLNARCDSLVVRHRGTTLAAVAVLQEIVAAASADTRDAGVAQGRSPASDPAAGADNLPAFALACCALALAPTLAPGAFVPLLLCGIPIWRRALGTLVHERRLNVDFLDGLALAITLARGQAFTGALMAWMVHLGDLIRDRTAMRSRRHARALLGFQSVQAKLIGPDGAVCEVPAHALAPGQTVLLRAGDLVPADGIVAAGLATVDQRSITGESVPAARGIGAPVYAGSAVVDGSLTLNVTHAGSDTAAARIVQMLEAVSLGETRVQNYAERFADHLVAPLLGANVALLAASGDVDRFLSMAIVDYGTGIRVAAPTSVLASMMRAAREGILIKGGHVVEQMARLRCVAFDKTGTLTWGRLAILDVHSFAAEVPADRVLQLAAAAETQLRHPLARALVLQASGTRGLVLPACDEVDFTIGLGVCALIGRHRVRVGSERYFRSAGIGFAKAASYLEAVERSGCSALLVALDESLVGAVAYADELRPEAPAVIGALKRRGVADIVMLTGDRHRIAQGVAQQLGIRHFYAEVLPAEKAEIVRQLRRTQSPIAMVGDGVNDSPALAQADVGISLVEGADIARDAADVVLMRDGLLRIVDAIDISRDALALVRQNFALIAAFNTLALGLSLPSGWVSPSVTTLLSNGSALLATLNAMRPLLPAYRSVRSFQISGNSTTSSILRR